MAILGGVLHDVHFEIYGPSYSQIKHRAGYALGAPLCLTGCYHSDLSHLVQVVLNNTLKAITHRKCFFFFWCNLFAHQYIFSTPRHLCFHTTQILRCEKATYLFLDWVWFVSQCAESHQAITRVEFMRITKESNMGLWTKTANFTLIEAAHTRSAPSVLTFHNKSPSQA